MSGREVGGAGEYRTHTLARLQYDDNFTCGARAGEERRLGVGFTQIVVSGVLPFT